MKTEAVKYVGLIMSQTSVERGKSVNAMVMLENTLNESVDCNVKLFIKDGANNENWQLCANKEYTISPNEHLHAYLSVSGEFLVNPDEDEFLVYAGDTPPEADTRMNGVSEIVVIEG